MDNNQANIDQILQHCLELIQSGQESLDSVIARYPEFEDVLRPELEIASWFTAHRDDLDPRPGFITASRKRLVTQIRQEMTGNHYNHAEAVALPRVSIWQAWQSRLGRARAPLASAFVLVVALIISSYGLITAARTSLPGEKLYPIKIAMEKASLAVSPNQAAVAQLSVEYTERRLDEINRLVIEGQYDNINESVTILENQVNETISNLDQTADENSGQAKELASSLKDLLVDQNEVLGKLAESAPAPARPALVRAMRVSQGGISAAQSLIQEASNPPSSSATPPSGSTSHPSATPFRPATSTPVVVVAPPTPTSAPTRNPFPTDPPEPTEPPRNTPRPTNPPPTNTAPPPTATPRPTDTPFPTRVPTDTPNPTPTPTDIPTNTPVPPPTDTPVPTLPPTNTPAPTAQPPTATPEPPTNTPRPPTDTPEPTSTPQIPTSTAIANPTAANLVSETPTGEPGS